MAEPTTTRIDDGRVARRLENRVRIVDALFTLIQRGNPHPTLKEIAEQAGVTSRTLLNHFPDVASLLNAATARGIELAEAKLPSPPAHGDLETRLREFFRAAASFYDGYAAIRWSSLTSPATRGCDMRQRKCQVLRLLADRIDTMLAASEIVLAEDSELRRALLTAIDPLAWRLLRQQQGLSRSEASASVACAVLALAQSARALREAHVAQSTRAASTLRA
jgi:AcrR family transcriptional regulator